MEYFIARASGHEGPYTIDQLRQRGVTPETYVWNNTMTEWTRAGNVPELAAALFGPIPTAEPARPEPPYREPAYMRPARPSSWLIPAILLSVCCCLPCGIVSIVYASKVDSSYNAGRYDEALDASRKAKTWFWVGLVAGALATAAYLVFYFTVLFSALSANGAFYNF